MQVRALRVFCEIANRRSFSRAASLHGMTQSAASQIVHQLEHTLGVQLIDRSKRPLILTEAGRLYYEGLQPIVHDYETLEDEVRSFGQSDSGHVEIAAIYSAGLSYMPAAKAALAVQHPRSDLHVQYGTTSKVYDLVFEGAADLGVVSYPRAKQFAKRSRSLCIVDWQTEPMRLVCSPNHPFAIRSQVKLADLTGQLMIGFDPALEVQQHVQGHLNSRGVSPEFDTGFDNIDTMVRAIETNAGMGILPEPAIRREIANDSLRVVHCPDLELTRPLGIIWRRGARLSSATLEFAALLLGRPLKPNELGKDSTARNSAKVKSPETIGS